jgi:hypothetical protein
MEDVFGPETVMVIPGIKREMAQCVNNTCNTILGKEVVKWFRSNCTTAVQVRDAIRKCTKSPRAGQTLVLADGTEYKIPQYNERAACGLLDYLIAKEAFTEPLLAKKVREMRTRMRGGVPNNVRFV